ncbi:ABC transporter ATP-binding protein [Cohnella xylanilytica]|uniref:ABC transporter ATP-binding protein n=1 Tax=Cohnella xylanilytica TaxID=557555 RepID=UPI001C88A735|nr:ABC transporter ATP-binding protein [Cohnella xylanilytica]
MSKPISPSSPALSSSSSSPSSLSSQFSLSSPSSASSLAASAAPSAGEFAVRVSNVTFAYPGSEQPVLREASLAIRKGSFAAIAGGNGCGKSTLCKLFNGLIPHYYSGEFSGSVEVCGRPAEGRGVAELSRQVGYVYQDFDNQLVRPTVLDEAVFAPLNYGLPEYRAMGQRALELCGISHLHDRYVWELSGGQKHLLALAGALALEPDVLVVDEPVSQLDPRHARQAYEVLRRLNRQHGITIIVIEHHTEFIADYCEEVCLMEQGRVLWQLPAAEALNRLADLDRLGIQPPEVTQAAAKLSELLGKPSAASSYPVTADDAEAYFGAILRRRAAETGSPGKEAGGGASAGEAPPSNPSPAIEFRRTELSYRTVRKEKREVLRGLDLALNEGERIALVGNNGAGKSSLLKLIAGIARPTGGDVRVLGEDAKGLSVERISARIAYVFQNPEDMFIEDTVYKEVAYCLKRRRYPQAEETAERMLRAFRLEPLRDRDARLLSGGQQRRVSLAIGAAIRPEIILLDEPTANLDLATREELIGTLKELEAHVRTVVIATHDMQLVRQWATRVVVLNEGVVAGDGAPADVFADADLIRRAGLAPTQIMDLSARLGLKPACASPAELAGRIYGMLAHGKENDSHAARPQLV